MTVRLKTLLFTLCFSLFLRFDTSCLEWKIQSPLLSSAQYTSLPFSDSGWLGRIPGGIRIPIELQVGVASLGSTLFTLNTGMSLGVLPSNSGFYSGISVGVGAYYNGQLQGFYSALYPAYDILLINKNAQTSPLWNIAIDVIGFDLDLTNNPSIQIGGYFRALLAIINPIPIPTLDFGVTLGAHFK